jgi:hypothetical protein
MVEERRARKRNVMLRLSDDERALVEALAESMGLSLSDAVRQALRAEAARRGVLAARGRGKRK